MKPSLDSIQVTNGGGGILHFNQRNDGYWRGRIEAYDGFTLFTGWLPSRLEVIHEAERRMKQVANMPLDTSDMDTQPIVVNLDEER